MVARLLSFAATVYLARRLGAGVYGVIGFVLAVRLYLQATVDAGIDSTGVRAVARDRGALAQVVPALITVRFVTALVLGLLTAAVAFLVLPRLEAAILAAYALTLLPLALNTRWVHIGLGNARPAAVARTMAEGLSLALMVTLIHGAGDIALAPVAQLAGELAAALLLAVLLARAGIRLSLPADWRPARETLLLTLPVLGHALLGLVMFNADLLFLRAFRPLDDVGRYAAAYTLVSFFLNLGVTYYHSLLPALSRPEGSTDAARAVYGLGLLRALAAGIPIAVGGSLLAGPLLGLFFGPTYAPAAPALAVLLWSVPVSLMLSVAHAGLVGAGQPAILLRTSLISAAVNVALNLALIPGFGMVGAAVATLLTEVLRASISLWFARAIGLVPLSWAGFAAPILAAGFMALVLVASGTRSVWVAVPLGAACYAAALLPGGRLRALVRDPVTPHPERMP